MAKAWAASRERSLDGCPGVAKGMSTVGTCFFVAVLLAYSNILESYSDCNRGARPIRRQPFNPSTMIRRTLVVAFCGCAAAFVATAPARASTALCASHGKRGFKKLSLPADQRKALLRSLTTETIRHGRITTRAATRACCARCRGRATTRPWASSSSSRLGVCRERSC
jgi:hypothetical protein